MLRRYTPLPVALPVLLVCGVLFGVTGCGKRSDPEASRAAAERRAKQRAAAQTDALLSSIASQLATLPEAVQLDLRPPAVIVDSRRSTDREDIEAVIVRPEGVPLEGPANLLRVPRRNARFRSADVRSGDTVKYFAELSDESRRRIEETGEADILQMEAVEFQVAQVLGENELLIVGGLAREIDIPLKVEIWRNVDDRMVEISRQLAAYANRREPPRGWQPSPDEAELRQLHERVNQWLRQSGGTPDGRSDAVKKWLATLPASITENERLAAVLSVDQIASGPFLPYDARLLQEAVWLRDVARRERGESFQPRDQATRLFDWTVRNLVLVDEAPPSDPWEAMLHGRATVAGRAWVFVRLCRAIGLDAVVLSVPIDDSVYLMAGVIDDEGVALYDPHLGLPIGSEPGSGVADLSLGTLAEDDDLLRAYDLPDSPYPITAAALSAAAPMIIAEPFSLTGRAAALESALTGADALVLTAPAQRTAEALAGAAPGLAAPVLWPHPFETVARKLTVPKSVRNDEVKAFLPFAWRPPLWKGRVLAFRGKIEDASARRDELAEPQNDFRAAQKSLMDRTLRPRDSRLAEVVSDVKRDIYFRAKAIATYWLGTTALERGDYQNALSWLENDALTNPATEWLADGVAYARALALEGLGQRDEAAEALRSSRSAQRHGDQLRAAWLMASTGSEASEADAETTP